MGKVCLLDHMTGANLGDAATQDAVIHNLRRRRPNVEIVLISHDPEGTFRRHGVDGFCLQPSDEHRLRARTDVEGPTVEELTAKESGYSLSALRLSVGLVKEIFKRVPGIRQLFRGVVAVWQEIFFSIRSFSRLRGVESLTISGGGQIDDTWGGAWEAPFNLLRWSVLARARGIRLAYLSVGAGPLRSSLSRFFVKVSLRLAHYRSFRDHDSAVLATDLGVSGNARVIPDLANSLPLTNQPEREWPRQPTATFGIVPLPYKDPNLYPDKDRSAYERYIRTLARFALWATEHGHTVRMINGDVYQDPLVIGDIRRTIERNATAAIRDSLIQNAVESVPELLQEIRESDVVISSRFHGVLFAQLLGKPVIAASYHQKIDSLMADVGQSEHCVHIDDLSLDWIIQCVRDIETRAPAIRRCILERVALRRRKLEMFYDEVFGCTAVTTPNG